MSQRFKLQTLAGMHDILPPDQKYFKKIYDAVSDIASFYGFEKIDTPLLEQEELYYKSTGTATDIVDKEMYNFKTKGGDQVALRPEWTPSIARAYIEHGMQSLPQPIKLWYFGPCFRHENPQSGRYRQFWQFGFEVLGEKSSSADAQIIHIIYNLLQELKIKNLMVEINSMGDGQCRPYYKKLLANYLKSREGSLCQDCKRRSKENILRVLDCKDEKCQQVKSEVPEILDHLCDECKKHFKEVLEFLDELEIPYNLNNCLVRGLDYYTKTVFEIFEAKETKEGRLEKSLALAGGGRYDKLLKVLGGRDIPACGFAAGVERIVNILKSQDAGKKIEEEEEYAVFLAQLGDLAKRKSLRLLEDLRRAKIKTAETFGRDSLKAQLGRADHMKAKYTIIIGQKEALENSAIIRNMENGKQEIEKLDKVVEEVKKKLKK